MSTEPSPVKIQKRPKRWYLFFIVNVCVLLAFFFALLALPVKIPFWWWVGGLIFNLALFNGIALLIRNSTHRGPPTSTHALPVTSPIETSRGAGDPYKPKDWFFRPGLRKQVSK
jgi:hypothetical protein